MPAGNVLMNAGHVRFTAGRILNCRIVWLHVMNVLTAVSCSLRKPAKILMFLICVLMPVLPVLRSATSIITSIVRRAQISAANVNPFAAMLRDKNMTSDYFSNHLL
jgi:hypothetical protein